MKTKIVLAGLVGMLPLCLRAQEPDVPTKPTLPEKPATTEAVDTSSIVDTLTAQDTVWLTTTSFGLNFNQAAFSDNWIGGGINSVAFSSFFNYQAHYTKDGWSWDNVVDLLYGVISSQDQGSRKSQDRIYLDTKVGRQLSNHWNGYFSLSLLTQFAPGYRYEEDTQGVQELLVSKFMSPGFLTASLGFEYDPNRYFILRLSPLSSRFTFVADTSVLENVEARYGLEPGDQVRRELFALQVQAEYDRNLTKTINLKTRYLLFANYESFGPTNWDHRLDLQFSAQLTRYINATLTTIFLYDRDQMPNPQISQSMGVGVLLQRKRAR